MRLRLHSMIAFIGLLVFSSPVRGEIYAPGDSLEHVRRGRVRLEPRRRG